MAFPTTGILDDFNRANVGPPPSASWTTGVFGGTAGLKVSSNQVVYNGTAASDGYWNVETFGPDCEVYATVAVLPGFGSVYTQFYVRLRQIAAGTTDGYGMIVESGGGYFIRRYDNGASTNIKSGDFGTMTAGDSFGLCATGSTIEAWRTVSGTWTLFDSVVDATYPDAGFIGLGAPLDATIRIDNFGGGTLGDPKSPATNISDTDNPAPTAIVWTNPGNITTSNNTYATAVLAVGELTEYLKATMGANVFAVPSGSTINGIKVQIERHASGTLVTDNELKIVKGGTIGATDKASGSAWAAADPNSYVTYGSSSDLWGETWTYSDVNDATFGVALSVINNHATLSRTASVDHIRIYVYYSPPGVPGTEYQTKNIPVWL